MNKPVGIEKRGRQLWSKVLILAAKKPFRNFVCVFFFLSNAAGRTNINIPTLPHPNLLKRLHLAAPPRFFVVLYYFFSSLIHFPHCMGAKSSHPPPTAGYHPLSLPMALKSTTAIVIFLFSESRGQNSYKTNAHRIFPKQRLPFKKCFYTRGSWGRLKKF